MLEDLSNNSCDNDLDIKPWDIGIGWFLTIMTFVSFLPQMVLLFQKRSNKGISLFSQVVGCIGSVTGCWNGLDTFWFDFYCCQSVFTTWECSQALLSFFQLSVQFLCAQAIYIIVLVFWPVGKTPEERKEIDFQRKLHWGIFTVYMLVICGVFVLAVYMNSNFSPKSDIYLTVDGAYGIIDGIATCLTWLPQFYVTYKVGENASLSVFTLVFQLPGMILLIYFYFVSGSGVWIWFPQLLATTLQLLLVLTCFYFGLKKGYTIREVVLGHFGEEEEGSQEDEDPLTDENKVLINK